MAIHYRELAEPCHRSKFRIDNREFLLNQDLYQLYVNFEKERGDPWKLQNVQAIMENEPEAEEDIS